MFEDIKDPVQRQKFLEMHAILMSEKKEYQESNIEPGIVTIQGIISDGTSTGTRIFLTDGREVGNVASISYKLDHNDIIPQIKMELADCKLMYIPSLNTAAKIPVYAINSASPKWFIRVYPPNWLRKIMGWFKSMVNLNGCCNGQSVYSLTDDEILDKLKDIKK